MQVTVTGRHYEVTTALRSYLDVRLNRLSRYTDEVFKAHVTLSAEKHRHRAEIVVHAEGKDFTSKEVAEDMYVAVDRVADKLEKQLRRLKGKRQAGRKAGTVRGAAANGHERIGTLRVLRAGTVGHGSQEHEIVEAGDYPIATMTVDEAILGLEEHEREFVVFANRGTDLIHIVYRSVDGNYGVLNLHATT